MRSRYLSIAAVISLGSVQAAESHSAPLRAGSQIASGSEIVARNAKIDNVQLHTSQRGKDRPCCFESEKLTKEQEWWIEIKEVGSPASGKFPLKM